VGGWLGRHRVRSAAKLPGFAENGYTYDEQRSTPDAPVFIR